MKKIGVISLGCTKNQVDTEMLLGQLITDGHVMTQEIKQAQWLIVNTCGFINSAKEESVDTILEMAEYKKTGLCEKLIVMGCLSQLTGKSLIDEIPEIDIMVGAGDIDTLINFLQNEDNFKKDGRPYPLGKSKKKVKIRKPQFDYKNIKNRVQTTPFYTSYIKIAEGCSCKCSFCLIPKARGPFKSRPYSSIVSEAKHLAGRGVVEVNLIAQNTTSYGFDTGKPDGLNDLLGDMLTIKDILWIRLLYANISQISSFLIDTFARDEKLCKYLDIPLQHINNDILKKMNRPTGEKEIRLVIDTIRKKIPTLSIRTTFIVGFPGETDKQFKQLFNFVKEEEFDHVGVFPFSSQRGTRAGEMIDSVPQAIKKQRVHRIMELQKKISFRKNNKMIGFSYAVLIESHIADYKGKNKKERLYAGRMQSQAPDVDGITYVKCMKNLTIGTIVPVMIKEAMEYDLVGSY